MIAAIYARKSQDDGRADDDENKSVARQEQRCRQLEAGRTGRAAGPGRPAIERAESEGGTT